MLGERALGFSKINLFSPVGRLPLAALYRVDMVKRRLPFWLNANQSRQQWQSGIDE